MLKWDPHKRVTAQKILQHPYFNNVELPEEIKNFYNNNGNVIINNNLNK